MPIYPFVCEQCQETTEQFLRSLDAEKITACPICGGTVRQLFQPALLLWRTSSGKNTISFDLRRKFTQPHKSFDAPKGTYYSFPNKEVEA